jgi:Rps23 Pro-64 3,4-dihydroxylase Tpa1-like proline 4-hydroxylase
VTTTPALELGRLERDLPTLAGRYRTAAPFPHLVLDDLLPAEVAERAAQEHASLPDEVWRAYVHLNERKYAHNDPRAWGPTLRAVTEQLNDPPFLRLLERLTGIDHLLPDPDLDGAGLHRSGRGGFLNVHADFTAHHRDPTLRRRVNLLLFLNPGWQPAWGGALELWSRDMTACVASIEPRANRIVVFNTDETAFHGHPDPLRCPPEVQRRSLALYYFTAERAVDVRSTNYRPRPGDGLRSVGIRLDSGALRAYDRVKRRFQLNDALVSRWSSRLLRRRR